MTLDQFDTFVGTVLLVYAALVLVAGVAKFLSRRHVPSALHSTAEPASRAAEVDVVDGRVVVASITAATEDSGERSAVPASEARSGATPGPELITQPREDPAVLGRDRVELTAASEAFTDAGSRSKGHSIAGDGSDSSRPSAASDPPTVALPWSW